MSPLAQELDQKLQSLDPARAEQLKLLVRDALDGIEEEKTGNPPTGWPEGYFEQTAGAFAGEEFERPPQGELPHREDW